MTMDGAKRGPRSEINVTPLVDVVLVLLIIFMVIIPMTQVGYSVNTPPISPIHSPTPPSDQLIVRLDAEGSLFLNREKVPAAQFEARFRDSIRNRANRMVFFAADGELTYDQVTSALDLCRNAGASNFGIVFSDLGSGPANGAGLAP